MTTVHPPLFDPMNNRKTKSECFISDYVATGDEEVETDDHDDEESIRQEHILTNRDQIGVLNNPTVCPS